MAKWRSGWRGKVGAVAALALVALGMGDGVGAAAPLGSGAATAAGVSPPAPHPYAQTFTLHSSAASPRKIYLDFGTFVDANGGVSDEFDLDRQPGFSNAELDVIQDVWARVAEGFSPFDVDVTTEKPGPAVLYPSDPSPTAFGARVKISNTSTNELTTSCGGCVGSASSGTFRHGTPSTDPMAVVVVNLLSPDETSPTGRNARNIASVAIREIGHTMGLRNSELPASALWRPIMFPIANSAPLQQWAIGPATGAEGSVQQDDYATIAAVGGVPGRTDEPGVIDQPGTGFSVAGVIAPFDQDAFRFTVPAGGRGYRISVTPSPYSPMLDVSATLYDGAGLVAVADPPAVPVDADQVAGLDATMDVSLAAGATYLLTVGGAVPPGVGTNYGSVGSYTVTVTPAEVPLPTCPNVASEAPRTPPVAQAIAGSAAASSAGAAPPAPHPYAQTFALHSLAASPRKIYLDFATFTDVQGCVSDAFDLDGRAGFSNAELDVIQDVWARVAEGFSPFDVDVTTENPGPAALYPSSPSPTTFGIRLKISNTSTAEVARPCRSPCQGIAYLGKFQEGAPSIDPGAIVLVDNMQLAARTPRSIAAVAIHEAGHSLGLTHSAQPPTALWMPLMATGVAGAPLQQWASGAAQSGGTQDDYAKIAEFGGVPQRADEPAVIDQPGIGFTASGVIASPNDQDSFRFTVPADRSGYRIVVTPSRHSPMLDVNATLFDSAGNVVVDADPPATPIDLDRTTGLDASMEVSVTPGATYTLRVRGAAPPGVGTNYGSVGTYTVTVSPANRADLALALSCPTTAKVGIAVTCNVLVTNRGPGTATSITTVFTLPEAARSVTTTPGAIRARNLATWRTPSLSGGSQATFTITYTPAGTGRQRVGAATASLVPDPALNNNTATIVQTTTRS